MLIVSFLDRSAQAQQSDEVESLRFMDTGIEYMAKEDYTVADKYFRMVIDEMNVLPTEICFYFGKNSYYLGKYKQSIDWLNKYIELKGVNGEFFDKSVAYLKKSEQEYLVQNNNKEKEIGKSSEEVKMTVNKPDSDKEIVNCTDVQRVVCPLCKGTGVLKKPGLLGTYMYETCPYGDSGVLTCEEFKLYVKGELKPKSSN